MCDPEVATHFAVRKKMHCNVLFLNSMQQEGEQRLEKNEIARDAEKDKRQMIYIKHEENIKEARK